MEAVDSYITLRRAEPVMQPKVRLNGQTVKWMWPHVFVSGIAGVDEFCTYEKGLVAKQIAEGEEEPPFSQETQDALDTGRDGHEGIRRDLDVPPAFDFSDRAKQVTVEALTALLSGPLTQTVEFPIVGFYRDLMIRGRLDYLAFTDGRPSLVEEWKFTAKGTLGEVHNTQTLIYAYLLHRWLGTVDIPCQLKAWTRGEWDKRRELQAVDSDLPGVVPTTVQRHIFRESDIPKVERYLQIAYDFFTGKTPCRPTPILPICRRCRVRDLCPYKDEYEGVGAHVVESNEDGSCLINFGR